MPNHASNGLPDDLEARPVDDDYDLLTFGEAGARLIEEIRRQRSRVESLLAAGRGTGNANNANNDTKGDAERLVAAQKRLDLLIAAQMRNAKPSTEALRARGFFSPRA